MNITVSGVPNKMLKMNTEQAMLLVIFFIVHCRCAEAGNCHVSGWPTFAYGLSSIGITVLTKIQQQDMDQTRPKQDILINAVCACVC